MSDEHVRKLNRAASVGGDDDIERASLALCRLGKHDWSHWERVGIWIGEKGGVVRSLSKRICFWCYNTQHSRIKCKPAPVPPSSDVNNSGSHTHGFPISDRHIGWPDLESQPRKDNRYWD